MVCAFCHYSFLFLPLGLHFWRRQSVKRPPQSIWRGIEKAERGGFDQCDLAFRSRGRLHFFTYPVTLRNGHGPPPHLPLPPLYWMDRLVVFFTSRFVGQQIIKSIAFWNFRLAASLYYVQSNFVPLIMLSDIVSIFCWEFDVTFFSRFFSRSNSDPSTLRWVIMRLIMICWVLFLYFLSVRLEQFYNVLNNP